MKKIKRVMAGCMCVFMIFGLFVGCNSNINNTTEENSPVASGSTVSVAPSPTAVDHKTMVGTISLWHFNNNETPSIQEAFKKEFPKVEVKMTIVPNSDYRYDNKVAAAIRAGSGAPDIFTAESAMVKSFVEMKDGYADITAKAQPYIGEMAKYTVDVGTDSTGKIRALSHQVTAGGIGYKKAVAKKYLGTDDPTEVAAMLSSQDKILETAKKLKHASGGKVALFPSWDEMKIMAMGGRDKGWVVDNKLNIDQKVLDLIDFSKTMRDNKYESGFDAWSAGWSSAIAADETAMCWSIPTWGIPWIINSNDPKASGNDKWGICNAPYGYFWGGTWFGSYSKTEVPDLAWEFIKWWTTDKTQLKAWSAKTGDIPNNTTLLKEGAASSDVDRIVGVNLYKFYQPIVGSINGSTLTQYDDRINVAFADVMKSYLAGKIKSKEEVVSQFKDKVKQNVKEITVE